MILTPSPFTSIVGSAADRRCVRQCLRGVDAVLHAATLHKPHVVTHGRQDFVDSKCTVCHFVGGEGNKKGPVLDGVGAKLTSDEIREWITNAPQKCTVA